VRKLLIFAILAIVVLVACDGEENVNPPATTYLEVKEIIENYEEDMVVIFSNEPSIAAVEVEAGEEDEIIFIFTIKDDFLVELFGLEADANVFDHHLSALEQFSISVREKYDLEILWTRIYQNSTEELFATTSTRFLIIDDEEEKSEE